VTWFGSKPANHFILPANTVIPPGLAATKDHKSREGADRYTLAPKDDMPLDPFLQHLRSLALAAQLST
jgi:hypothetical protein